ncbi:ShlB/FhaC/HecB family hemolysin secretion/activation protein [Sphingomonas crusticola]|uniref:ShlB/FhaC/HecB family hemolysin secretion/activation protein n=1 Tax=Sphingomonas crusticola TaxID=1697973 RepID=UPI0019689513|nr:ShlB/FhaC/HecB family hemolysin secretion/activation protein [Sphingomonas crusticola]
MIAIIAIAPAPALRAQTASQITPPTFAPPPAVRGAPIVIPEGSGAAAPAGAEALEVKLAAVAIEGAPVAGKAVDAAQAALRAQLVGRSVKVSEIFAAARALESAYARAGRVLVRVTVPPQSLADGATLRLVVIDGFVERVDTAAVPARVRTRIAALLAPLVSRPGLTLSEIERQLLLASDVPGVSLRSTLAAGSTSGGSVLVIEAQHRPVTAFLTMDNTLPRTLGHYGYGVGLNFNSVLGLGETIYLRASSLPNTGHDGMLDPTPRNRALAAGAILPLPYDLTFNLEGTDARTTPRRQLGAPAFASRFQRLSGRLRYPAVRTRALTMALEADLDVENERVRIVDPLVLPLSLDRLRVARLGSDISLALPGAGLLRTRATLSFGLDALGARSASDATPDLPLSRQGADASFRKLEVSAELDQPLAPHLRIDLRARAQSAFGDALANSEQLGIAALDAISPLSSGLLQGDAGYVARGEVQTPFGTQLNGGSLLISPYAFGAHGRVRFEQPTFLERRQTDATAYGVGARFAASPGSILSNLGATLEWGRAEVDGLPGHTHRLSFTFVVQF